MNTRRVILNLHVWAGLLIGLFWMIQGTTGAALVFNRDIQVAYLASSAGHDRLPLDAVLTRTAAAVGGPITRLETFGPDPLLLLAYHKTPAGERVAVVDWRDGAIVDARDMHANLPSGGETWPWLLRLHESLLADDAGLVVVGCLGVVLVIGMGLGLWTALPYRNWRGAWKMTRMAGARQRLVGWHRLGGLTGAPLLLLLAACGVYLAFAPEIRALLAQRAGYAMPYKPAPAEAAPPVRVSAEEAYAAARQRFPGATLVRLVIPSKASPVYLFRLLQPGDARRWAGTSTVAVDPGSGRIVDAYDSAHGPLANRATDLIYSIHTGDVGGVGGRILVFLAGLALPAFAITGWISWLKKRRKRG